MQQQRCAAQHQLDAYRLCLWRARTFPLFPAHTRCQPSSAHALKVDGARAPSWRFTLVTGESVAWGSYSLTHPSGVTGESVAWGSCSLTHPSGVIGESVAWGSCSLTYPSGVTGESVAWGSCSLAAPPLTDAMSCQGACRGGRSSGQGGSSAQGAGPAYITLQKGFDAAHLIVSCVPHHALVCLQAHEQPFAAARILSFLSFQVCTALG